VEPKLRHLYAHLLENGFIEAIRNYHSEYLHIRPADVLKLLRAGDPSWSAMVPSEVGEIIKTRNLFQTH
jgi:hypothetical protein